MHSNNAAAAATTASAKGLGRDRAEPSFSITCLEGTEIGRRIQRADPAGTPDIGQSPIRYVVNSGDRDPVIGCDEAVAGIDQFWGLWGLAMQESSNGVGAHFRLSICRERRFRHRTGNRGIA